MPVPQYAIKDHAIKQETCIIDPEWPSLPSNAVHMSQVSDAASAVLDALPPPAAEALQAAASAVQPAAEAVWAYATSDPKAGATVAGLAVGLPLLSFWRARLSGYSGMLPPDKVLQLLNKSNSLLIDIRCVFA